MAHAASYPMNERLGTAALPNWKKTFANIKKLKMADTYEKFLQTFVIFFGQTFVFVPKNQNNFFPCKKFRRDFSVEMWMRRKMRNGSNKHFFERSKVHRNISSKFNSLQRSFNSNSNNRTISSKCICRADSLKEYF